MVNLLIFQDCQVRELSFVPNGGLNLIVWRRNSLPPTEPPNALVVGDRQLRIWESSAQFLLCYPVVFCFFLPFFLIMCMTKRRADES